MLRRVASMHPDENSRQLYLKSAGACHIMFWSQPTFYLEQHAYVLEKSHPENSQTEVKSRLLVLQGKRQKKKCNEQHPRCDRCAEHDLVCEYEPIRPRKRKRTSSALAQDGGLRMYTHGHWDLNSTYAYSSPVSSVGASTYNQEGDFNLVGGEIEEIVRPGSFIDSMTGGGSLVRSRIHCPDLAMIAPSHVVSPLLGFSMPAFTEFSERKSRRALVGHFCSVLSHLVVFKEDTGNPFQQLVLPLSHTSPPVLNAIFALSSAHLEYRGVVNEEKSHEFHNRALRGLATLIDDNQNASCEEVLGAIMLLVYYEVLTQRKDSGIVQSHLKGAMTVIRAQKQERSPTSLFLEQAFRFYDVITALSLGTSPISTTPTAQSPLNIPILPSISPLNSVDTLLGMATELWPIIHRLSHLQEARRELQAATLSGNMAKVAVLRTELESTCHAIEIALTNWRPSIRSFSSSPPRHVPEADLDKEENARLQSILSSAEAYRHAAFVYLYKEIQNFPRTSKKVQQHTKLALHACGRVVEWAGPMGALLWPLFVSSCEAVDLEDRELARRAFEGAERRQGMNNIARAWDVVEESWSREDAGSEAGWREICAEKGFRIVFG